MESLRHTIMRALENSDSRPSKDTLRMVGGEAILHFQRLCFLLLSPHHFSRTFRRLQSLNFEEKTLIIGRSLLQLLRKLDSLLGTPDTGGGGGGGGGGLRDSDAGLLLLLIFEVLGCDKEIGTMGRRRMACPEDWRARLAEHFAPHLLSLAGFGLGGGSVLGWYADTVARYERVWTASVRLVGVGVFGGGFGEKVMPSVPASVATVVSLEEVVVAEEEAECVICREDFRSNSGGCGLACGHVFHSGCIVSWLKRASSCPVCRFELPTDDVIWEIGRLRRLLLERSSPAF